MEQSRMANIVFILHVLYSANIVFLLTGVLLVRDVWRPINHALIGATGIRMPWMPAIFALILLFLLIGLLLVALDIREIARGESPAATKFGSGALIAILILSNASIIPIVARVSVMGYVPFVSRISRALLRPETDYVLPEALKSSDGTEVVDSNMWVKKRRPEILSLFENEIYGRVPGREISARIFPASIDMFALNGTAIRKEVVLSFENGGRRLDLNILIYLPKKSDGPAPAFVGLNFFGNHTIQNDPGITKSNKRSSGNLDDPAFGQTRGSRDDHWPVERILQRGYALITMHCNDVDPDFDDGFRNGVHPLFYREKQERPGPNEWGSISAWAWGLSRIMDYLETDADIDHTRVAVMGHSRLGKTALWAGAKDERFAIVISNNSGCMGAALSRRKYGETVKDISSTYPYWFCANFMKYAGREDELPVDQHMLIALVAPRPVYIASADLDLWADPEGEFLAAKAASETYQLFEKDGLTADKQPDLHKPVMSAIGYHVRKGIHSVTDYDWDRFMDFADIYGGLD
jgi:hypothetical protein